MEKYGSTLIILAKIKNEMLCAWVKVQNFQNTENQSWGPGGRRAPGGSRATPWLGAQGAGGPRKLQE